MTLIGVAGALGVAAVVVPSGGVDMSASPATAHRTPTTTTTTTTTTSAASIEHAPTTSAASPQPAPLPVTSTTMALSPLASLVGPPLPVIPPSVVSVIAPMRIRIGALAVDDPIIAVGVEPDGQLEIPDEHHVGWYRLGAAPGQPGATVLAAHVNWSGVNGPFVDLRTIEPGTIVDVDLADGITRTYEVVERQQYDKASLPADRIWTHDGPEALVLITCGGDFNPDIHRYRHNIVAYAIPTGAPS